MAAFKFQSAKKQASKFVSTEFTKMFVKAYSKTRG